MGKPIIQTDTYPQKNKGNAIRRKIDLNKICMDYGVRVCSYKSAKKLLKEIDYDPYETKNPGISFRASDGTPVILFDSDRSDLEIRFTAAHELGHILLGHLDYRSKEKDSYPNYAELEANFFAISIITHDILQEYAAMTNI